MSGDPLHYRATDLGADGGIEMKLEWLLLHQIDEMRISEIESFGHPKSSESQRDSDLGAAEGRVYRRLFKRVQE